MLLHAGPVEETRAFRDEGVTKLTACLAPGLAPAMPAAGLEPGAHPLAVTRAEGLAGIAPREAVDVDEVLVVFDRDDLPKQAHVPVPAVLTSAEDGQRHARVAAHVAEPEPRVLHVQQRTSVLLVVPGGHRVRRAVRSQGSHDSRVRQAQELVDFG